MSSAWLTPPHACFFSADVPLDRGTASLLGLAAGSAALPPAWQRLLVLPRDDLLRHWGSPTLLKLALFRYVRVPLCVGVARASLPCAAARPTCWRRSHTASSRNCLVWAPSLARAAPYSLAAPLPTALLLAPPRRRRVCCA